ncbi:uncharacterized protein LOC127242181 [Andrographis paniculata]|uniref:uncharacterized protein LOC127242181 n=1 Tax=Andrographis paniculata TaxID=175694 RepID=UPI0021E73B1B|nr:uncharacterized protein LOC127242181 [Andrographis paniculata]XP_051117577.1 uncharacterized protein LOC127242181 [Andrographis paniculata]
MDLFGKAKSVRLMSYNDRYLTADGDQQTVTHTSHRESSSTIWTVEMMEDENDFIRLKSCHGTYLTASSSPFLPGVTGKKVIQTEMESSSYCDPAPKWQPLRDGMQVRLRSFCGNYLRPNGGLPPWRGSVTHDVPHRPKTRDKLLWDVEVVEKSADNKQTTD